MMIMKSKNSFTAYVTMETLPSRVVDVIEVKLEIVVVVVIGILVVSDSFSDDLLEADSMTIPIIPEAKSNKIIATKIEMMVLFLNCLPPLLPCASW